MLWTTGVFDKTFLLPVIQKKYSGSGGIRTHASEETGALNQRLRPLGHATLQCFLMALVKAAFLRKGGFGQTVIPG